MIIKHYVAIFLYKKSGRGKDWLDKRIDLAYDTSLRSLKNQTNKDFETVIVTNRDSISQVKARLGKNFTYIISKKDLDRKLDKRPKDLVYVTRLDSDDMYHPTVIEDIRSMNVAGYSGLINQDGYLFDANSGKMAEFHHDNIAFQTVIHRGDEWRDIRGLGIYPHNELRARFRVKALPPWKYLFILHGDNDSSGPDLFRSNWAGRTLTHGEATAVLKEFKWQRNNIGR